MEMTIVSWQVRGNGLLPCRPRKLGRHGNKLASLDESAGTSCHSAGLCPEADFFLNGYRTRRLPLSLPWRSLSEMASKSPRQTAQAAPYPRKSNSVMLAFEFPSVTASCEP